jgi:heme/copper-type cytochrome/quinol oxidase subunit 4
VYKKLFGGLPKKYFFYMIPVAFLMAFSQEIENTIAKIITASLAVLILLIALIHFGISIKNKRNQKKYIVYTSIFTVQIVLIVLLSEVFNVDTENPLLFIIFAPIFFSTMITATFDVAKTIRATHKKESDFLYLFATVGIFASLIAFFILLAEFFA